MAENILEKDADMNSDEPWPSTFFDLDQSLIHIASQFSQYNDLQRSIGSSQGPSERDTIDPSLLLRQTDKEEDLSNVDVGWDTWIDFNPESITIQPARSNCSRPFTSAEYPQSYPEQGYTGFSELLMPFSNSELSSNYDANNYFSINNAHMNGFGMYDGELGFTDYQRQHPEPVGLISISSSQVQVLQPMDISCSPFPKALQSPCLGEKADVLFAGYNCLAQQDIRVPSLGSEHCIPRDHIQHQFSWNSDLSGRTGIYESTEIPNPAFSGNDDVKQFNLGRLLDDSSPQLLTPVSGIGTTIKEISSQHEEIRGIDYGPVRRAFGPSKPVRLHPRQKRKRGLMSYKEKENFAKAKRNTCWRCKKDKKKCDGKTPCSNCIKVAKKARILKQPCTKAYFSDFVLTGSYFLLPMLYQEIIFKSQSRHDLIGQLVVSKKLFQRDRTFMTKEVHGPPVGCVIWWAQTMLVFKEALDCEAEILLNSNFELAAELEKAPLKFVEKSNPRLYFFEVPVHRSTQEEWLMNRIYFCRLRSWTLERRGESNFDTPIGIQPQQVHQAAMMNIWLTIRQCEIELFKYLEKFVNGDISNTQRSHIKNVIRAMTALIVGGSTEESALYPAFERHYKVDIELLHRFKDRHERIRAALFVYVCILMTKLPKPTSFWDLFEDLECISEVNFAFKDCLANINVLSSGFKAWNKTCRSHIPSTTVDDLRYFEDGTNSPQLFSNSSAAKVEDNITHPILNEGFKNIYLLFSPLQFIDWKGLLPRSPQLSQETDTVSAQCPISAHYTDSRVKKVLLAGIIRESLSDTRILLADIVRNFEILINGITPHLNNCLQSLTRKNIQALFSALFSVPSEGQWSSEFIEIFQSQNILLLHKGFLNTLDTVLQELNLNIPQIVPHGTNDNFNNLKYIFARYKSWLKDMHETLDAFLRSLFHGVVLLQLKDFGATHEIEYQLQDMVTEFLGSLQLHR